MTDRTDDEDRQNEGAFVVGVQFARPRRINCISEYGERVKGIGRTQETKESLHPERMKTLWERAPGTWARISVHAREGI